MILRRELEAAVKYIKEVALEGAASKEDAIVYVHWDFAKHARAKGPAVNVLAGLEEEVLHSLERTGIFHAHLSDRGTGFQGSACRIHAIQNGVLRTNCIDCLDRTNVAQYALGLCALRLQVRQVRARMCNHVGQSVIMS
mmetsp:Transcript_5700/g.20754  ORF Transcript_5700/g.20754 Transcript_5700/m.20754 type:complete len:139 (-) Transcript_5700:3029-3445(-)